MKKKLLALITVISLVLSSFPVMQVLANNDSPHFQMVDISPFATSKAYLLQTATPMTFADANVQYPHDYIFWDSNNNCIMMNKANLASKLSPEGVLSDKNGVPFHMPLDLAIEVRANGGGKTYVPMTTVDLQNKPYDKIHFLASRVKDLGDNIHININYADGTRTIFTNFGIRGRKITLDPNVLVTSVDAFVYWGSGDLISADNYIDIGTYSVQPDANKIVDSITFRSSNHLDGCKVLAVTTEGKNISDFINDLPEIGSITEDNYQSAQDLINVIEQDMIIQGVTEQDLSGAELSKLNSTRDKISYVKKVFQTINIAPYATSKVYLDAPFGVNDIAFSAANVEYPHDYLHWGNYDNCGALSRNDMARIVGDDGILTDKKGVPYSMPLDKAIEVRANKTTPSITYVPRTVIRLGDIPYENIHFLAGSVDGTPTNFHIDIIYTDGETVPIYNFPILPFNSATTENRVCAPEWFNYWGSGNYTKQTGRFSIFSYSVKPQQGREVAMVAFYSNYFSFGAKIFAVTTERKGSKYDLARSADSITAQNAESNKNTINTAYENAKWAAQRGLESWSDFAPLLNLKSIINKGPVIVSNTSLSESTVTPGKKTFSATLNSVSLTQQPYVLMVAVYNAEGNQLQRIEQVSQGALSVENSLTPSVDIEVADGEKVKYFAWDFSDMKPLNASGTVNSN